MQGRVNFLRRGSKSTVVARSVANRAEWFQVLKLWIDTRSYDSSVNSLRAAKIIPVLLSAWPTTLMTLAQSQSS
jgi:hypothetical protein